jgi:hypothetical protein
MAERKAREAGLELCRIEALIAKGEVYYWMSTAFRRDDAHLNSAIEAFRAALKIGKDSPRYAAVCYLHLARTYIAQSNRDPASACFSEYERLRSHIQNGFILELERNIRNELFSRDLLILDPSAVEPGRGVYESLEKQLRQFLLNQYKEWNRVEASEELGISRQTLLNWLKSIEEDSQRQAPKAKVAAV